MKRITLKEYAVKHKLSIFNVMKMVRTGKLHSEEVEEASKKVLYILFDEESEEKIAKEIVPIEHSEKMDLEKEVQLLKKEVQALKLALEDLKSRF